MWGGCTDRLDPAWNPRNEDPKNITTATPDVDQPDTLVTSKDDE